MRTVMDLKADDFGKRKIYEEMVSMLSSLCEGQSDQAAILANAAALIKEKTGFFWVGFYLVRPCIPHKPLFDSEELRLGPFQGPVACYQIARGKGVCGASWLRAQTLVVPDVEEFPGHIACSSLSKSEIVVPLNRPRDGKVMGVLDIDSIEKGTFSDIDKEYLEKACDIISAALWD